MTQSTLVPVRLCVLLAAFPAFAQTSLDEDYRVYTDPPRLLLNRQRLRLLQRERERQSMRWQQFDALVSGGAPMPEPGLAWALYYRVTGNEAIGRKAVEFALGDKADLRQVALVFDWCGPLLTTVQKNQLVGKAGRAPPSAATPAMSARALAAIAMADQLPGHGEAILRKVILEWWRGDVVKRIEGGRPAIPREHLYALYELLHAVRDNLKIDLREPAARYFQTLPVDHIASHYPGPFEAPENEYRIPVYAHEGEPDLADAVSSRATELAMVAYDDNALESQYLQGWLMQDRFMMRSGLGAVYEFLWANPYQPGLSYFHIPLVFHDPATGHVFARTSWDEDATWIGYFDGHLQLFRDGRVQALRPGAATKPVRIGDAVLLSATAQDSMKFQADSEAVFILGLAPRARYDVEIDDQELWETETDAGGTLVLAFPAGAGTGVRIRKLKD